MVGESIVRRPHAHYLNKLHRLIEQPWVWTALTAISIVATGKFSFAFASVNEISPVWLPSGVALTALLLSNFRLWLGVWLGFCVLDIHLHGLWLGSVMGTGEASEAFIAAYLITRFVPNGDILSGVRYAFYFIVAAAISPIFNATLGTFILYQQGVLNDTGYFHGWYTWWLADMVGILVLLPFFQVWLSPARRGKRLGWRYWLELGLLIASTGLVCYQVFVHTAPYNYLLIPLLIWSAFRFSDRITLSLLVGMTVFAVLAATHGYGTFLTMLKSYDTELHPSAIDASLELLQSFVAVIAVTTIILVAMITNQRTTETKLQEALNHLQLTQSQLVQTEKMSSLGQLVAGIAHEINNPVNFIYGNLTHAGEYTHDLLHLVHLYQHHYPQPVAEIQAEAEAIDLDFLQDDLPKLLHSMRVGAERIQKIVLALRTFSRMDEAEVKAVDVHEGIDSSLMILQNRIKKTAGHPSIQVIKQYGQLPRIECYASQLNQVFMNLLNNAIDALDEFNSTRSIAELQYHPATITITTDVIREHWIQIRIADNGKGMTDLVQRRLFEPFFTTKQVGKGTGLGLSISYQIVVDKHQGRISCQSGPGQGCLFVVELPIKLNR